ncbi:MAG: BrnT family toxin [Proteobacteria bacterium]|nr:BrnT family toxin [Pseudomonadota bacterium]
MDEINFNWDKQKNRTNQKKHGVSFEEAKTVFFDQNARLISDPDHSKDEERFILMGFSSHLKLLIVCHCYREEGQTIRIFSARKASKAEQKQYSGF